MLTEAFLNFHQIFLMIFQSSAVCISSEHITLWIFIKKPKKSTKKKRLRIALFNFYPISKSLPGTSKAPKTRVSSTIPNSSLVKKRRNKVSSRPVCVCVCMYQAPVFCYFFSLCILYWLSNVVVRIRSIWLWLSDGPNHTSTMLFFKGQICCCKLSIICTVAKEEKFWSEMRLQNIHLTSAKLSSREIRILKL